MVCPYSGVLFTVLYKGNGGVEEAAQRVKALAVKT